MSEDLRKPRLRYRLWRRWHNVRCAECRPRYTFWTARPIPLAEQARE